MHYIHVVFKTKSVYPLRMLHSIISFCFFFVLFCLFFCFVFFFVFLLSKIVFDGVQKQKVKLIFGKIYTIAKQLCIVDFNNSVFVLYVHSRFAIILTGKRWLAALLGLSSWCLLIVMWLFLAVPWVCLRFVIVVLPGHSHYFQQGFFFFGGGGGVEIYTQKQKKPISHFSRQVCKSELKNEIIFIPYPVAISFRSFH